MVSAQDSYCQALSKVDDSATVGNTVNKNGAGAFSPEDWKYVELGMSLGAYLDGDDINDKEPEQLINIIAATAV